ncbi:hypothetical protein CDAR_471441 [Caerostris darwini]|uniref:Uncharacterized protein n=1 Tax=Caerostris darwini TaxID=1538125 RepID=A0AAV4RMW9_9ARAC|nr:hypothetical protein CDAR_471441 [Caerostris darwini]
MNDTLFNLLRHGAVPALFFYDQSFLFLFPSRKMSLMKMGLVMMKGALEESEFISTTLQRIICNSLESAGDYERYVKEEWLQCQASNSSSIYILEDGYSSIFIF